MSVTTGGELLTTGDLEDQTGLPQHRLRRELEILELAGRMRFARVAGARVIRPEQVAEIMDWLRQRGLLAAEQ